MVALGVSQRMVSKYLADLILEPGSKLRLGRKSTKPRATRRVLVAPKQRAEGSLAQRLLDFAALNPSSGRAHLPEHELGAPPINSRSHARKRALCGAPMRMPGPPSVLGAVHPGYEETCDDPASGRHRHCGARPDAPAQRAEPRRMSWPNRLVAGDRHCGDRDIAVIERHCGDRHCERDHAEGTSAIRPGANRIRTAEVELESAAEPRPSRSSGRPSFRARTSGPGKWSCCSWRRAASRSGSRFRIPALPRANRLVRICSMVPNRACHHRMRRNQPGAILHKS